MDPQIHTRVVVFVSQDNIPDSECETDPKSTLEWCCLLLQENILDSECGMDPQIHTRDIITYNILIVIVYISIYM